MAWQWVRSILDDMFGNGQRVVCIDDAFEDWAVRMYDALPVSGVAYTVATSNFGRTDPGCTDPSSMDAKITLRELKNPLDPFYTGGEQELGFRADRFAPLDELGDEEAAAMEPEDCERELVAR